MGNTQKKSYSLEATPSKQNSQKTFNSVLPESRPNDVPTVKVNNEPLPIEVTGVEEDQKLKSVVDAPTRTNE